MSGKKKIWLGTGIALGAVMIALGGYGLSFIGRESTDKEPTYTDADYGEWVVTLAPTCEEYGVETRALLSSPEITQERKIAPLGHGWGDWYLKTEPTCITDGANERECSACHNLDYQALPALGHRWGERIVTLAPTYYEEGEETRVCANDSTHTLTRTIPVLMNAELDFVLNYGGTSYSVQLKNKDEVKGTAIVPETYEGLPVSAIAESGFADAPGLARVVVSGNKLFSIEERAFADCPMLKEVVIEGNHVWSIRDSAFKNCTALESFSIPEGVRSIGSSPFGNCEKLKSISIPASVTDIWTVDPLTFNCPSLETIAVAEGNPVYRSENNCLIERATNTLLVGAKNSLIPAGVETIYRYAFAYAAIERIAIPESVTEISDRAFEYCSALTEVVFEGSSEIEISSNAFSGCTRVARLELPAGVISLSTAAFGRWTKEQTIIVKRFDSASEADTFWGVAWRRDCNATILYETGIEYDYGEQLAFFLIANGTEYGVKALDQNLTGTVTIPATHNGLPVTKIPDVAFARRSGIKKLVVEGNNLKSIGEKAFANCLFEDFIVPEGVTKIGYRAFYWCGIKNLSLPASLTEISDNELLYRCYALESVTVAEGNPVYRSGGNCLILSATNTLLSGGKNAVIPAGIVKIGMHAFEYTAIGSVRIPESVTEISDRAFEYCSALTEVVFEGAASIGEFAFGGCTGIARLELPAGITEVGAGAFVNWTEEQTIIVKGFASEKEASKVWSYLWDVGCNATIIYEKEDSIS